MAGKNIAEVTDENFQKEITEASTPALVDFWAPWCGPCRAIAPVVEELAVQFQGQIKIGKLNVDDNPKTPGQYGIRAIPTMLLFKGGRVIEQIVGLLPKAALKTKLAAQI